LPWIIAGSTVAALSAVLLVRLSTPPSAGARNAAMQPAPDISNMSPRERADRLFNRVMSAVERGDTAEVNFFMSMAIQSYGLLGELDPDARYHLGLIQFVNRDLTATLLQADSITRTAPSHLLAGILRVQVATIRRDSTARNSAYRRFLADYDKEIALGRPEYAHHTAILEQTRTDARRALGR
jgi:hypothetical protein